jgi:hypothetical protein
MLFVPAAVLAAARVLNGDDASPLPAAVLESSTYQTSVPTVIVVVAVVVLLGALLPAIV